MFHAPSSKQIMALVIQAQQAMGLTQEKLGELVGSSKRTVQRWSAGRSRPSDPQIVTIARGVFAKDVSLATALVAAVGGTLESEGLVEPAAPIVAAEVAPPFSPAASHLVDSVVCAAADAMNVAPSAMRPALLAAFTRAQQMGFDLEGATQALATAPSS